MPTRTKRTKMVNIRFTEAEYAALCRLRDQSGFKNISELTRHLLSRTLDDRHKGSVKEVMAKIDRLQQSFDAIMARARQHRTSSSAGQITQSRRA